MTRPAALLRRRFVSFALLILSAASAQATENEYRLGLAPPRVETAAPRASSPRAQSGEYSLAGGDTLKITVFQNPDLTTETRVSENGTITFPLIGTVKIGGMALSRAETEIARRLESGGFVIQPQVSINITAIVGNQVSVLGQVNKPGSYPLLNFGYRLSQMLATAGGISPAGGDEVVVSGTRDGAAYHVTVNVEDLYSDNAPPQNDPVLSAGDSIYVPRAKQFFIYGQVQKPGSYPLTRDMTVMQALAQGGGLTLRGSERSLRIHRKGEDGKVKEFKPKMDEMVKPDDVLNIGESLF